MSSLKLYADRKRGASFYKPIFSARMNVFYVHETKSLFEVKTILPKRITDKSL